MIEQTGIVAAFLVGLLGSAHCIGMCGGIVGALSFGVSREGGQSSGLRTAGYLLGYNAGRIASYAAAGLIAGFVGTQFYSLVSLEHAREVSHWIAGGFMIALGLYLVGLTQILAPLERAGGALWRRIEPLGRGLIPVRHPWQALVLGLIWGWLPCGLVYSALVLALTSGGSVSGASLMTAFGLGTLPMLLAMGAASRWLGGLVRSSWVRRGAGVTVLTFGLVTALAPSLLHKHHHGSPDAGDGASHQHRFQPPRHAVDDPNRGGA
ncbi:MAG: sulfite exporter TauE/SafE family protein [Gammaproteobacteria bacterium]|nr:sulfite exporter TauE/SafE family protein [Gammaproteobacteria bacterium]